VRRTPASLTSGPGVVILFVLGRTWQWEWYGGERKAADVTNEFFARMLGLQRELEPTTKNIFSGFAWRERELSLAVESDRGLACQVYFAGQRTTLERADVHSHVCHIQICKLHIRGITRNVCA
jgi:hypothetical protein